MFRSSTSTSTNKNLGKNLALSISATLKAIKGATLKSHLSAGFLVLSNLASSAMAAENFTNAKTPGLEPKHTHSTLTLAQTQQAALAGDSRAQFILGHAYLNGKDIEQDQLTGTKWIQKAADQGLAVAQYQLGLIYEYGQGIPANHQMAATWYLKAAKQGNIGAQHSIGMMFLEGKGIEKNLVNAYAWLALSYENGYRAVKVICDHIAMKLTENQQLQAQVRMQAYKNQSHFGGQLAAAI